MYYLDRHIHMETILKGLSFTTVWFKKYAQKLIIYPIYANLDDTVAILLFYLPLEIHIHFNLYI